MTYEDCLLFRRRFTRKTGLLALFTLGVVVVAPLVQAEGKGYWRTRGSAIVDAKGQHVRIAGVNWYGFETTDKVAHGLSTQDYRSILMSVHSLGYNTIRLPFSNDMVENPITPSSISYSNAGGAINTDLRGLSSLQVMDKIVSAAGFLGLRIILDDHRSEAGDSAEGSGLWYTSSYPEAKWIADWQMLVKRYSSYKDGMGNPTLIGVDLRNEPHNAASGGACWTGDSSANGCPASNVAQNWPVAAERAAAAVLSINSQLLIFVEGTDEYNNDFGWWGGNLEGANSYPVHLSVPQRLVYSAHDYGPHEHIQRWSGSNTTAASLQAVWTRFWAYLSINGTTPVLLSEFGTTNAPGDIQNPAPGSQGQWFSSLVRFLHAHPDLSWTYWAVNGEDRYGLLGTNYEDTAVSEMKQQQLASIQRALSDSGGTSP